MAGQPPPYTKLPPPSQPSAPPVYHHASPETEHAKLTHAPVYPPQAVPPGGYDSTNNAVIAQPQPISAHLVEYEDVYPSNTVALILSCFVCYFCCCLFGLIGFITAVQSNSSPSAREARLRVQCAYRWCIAGLIVGTIVYITSTVVNITVNVNDKHW